MSTSVLARFQRSVDCNSYKMYILTACLVLSKVIWLQIVHGHCSWSPAYIRLWLCSTHARSRYEKYRETTERCVQCQPQTCNSISSTFHKLLQWQPHLQVCHENLYNISLVIILYPYWLYINFVWFFLVHVVECQLTLFSL